MKKRDVAAAILVLSLVAVASGCGDPPPEPEIEVRRTLSAIAAAAREGDLATLRDHVSERYHDGRGNDARALRGLLAYHTLRRQNIHVFSRVKSIQLPRPDRAQVEVAAAFAAREIASREALFDIQASLYHFELELEKEEDGTWRALSASWRQTSLEEF